MNDREHSATEAWSELDARRRLQSGYDLFSNEPDVLDDERKFARRQLELRRQLGSWQAVEECVKEDER
jgi:hypothetical protein